MNPTRSSSTVEYYFGWETVASPPHPNDEAQEYVVARTRVADIATGFTADYAPASDGEAVEVARITGAYALMYRRQLIARACRISAAWNAENSNV
jgi:hypothetical protein